MEIGLCWNEENFGEQTCAIAPLFISLSTICPPPDCPHLSLLPPLLLSFLSLQTSSLDLKSGNDWFGETASNKWRSEGIPFFENVLVVQEFNLHHSHIIGWGNCLYYYLLLSQLFSFGRVVEIRELPNLHFKTKSPGSLGGSVH